MVFVYVPVISHPIPPPNPHGHCVLIDFFIYLSAQCAATLQYSILDWRIYILAAELHFPNCQEPKTKTMHLVRGVKGGGVFPGGWGCMRGIVKKKT